MNQQQKNYAMARVSFITESKKKEIIAKFTTPAKKLTDQQATDLIASGKVKFLPMKFNRYTDLFDAYDFSKYESDAVYDEVRANPLIAKLQAESVKVQDILMLGDEDDALKAIRDFEKFVEK